MIDKRRSRSRKSPPTILRGPDTKPGNSRATLKSMTGSRSTLLPLCMRSERCNLEVVRSVSRMGWWWWFVRCLEVAVLMSDLIVCLSGVGTSGVDEGIGCLKRRWSGSLRGRVACGSAKILWPTVARN